MPRRAILTALATVAASVSPLGGAAAATAEAPSASVFRSSALDGPLHFSIVLPKGYATSALRYPVIYFLHGLPASSTAYRALGWVERALEATGRKAILVLPQAASSTSSDPEYH